MAVLGTDIEQSIREAIAETLGGMRYEMWFGNNAKVEILGNKIRVHAVNPFAADWVEKNYLTTIRGGCLAVLEMDQRIEIVSQDQVASEINLGMNIRSHNQGSPHKYGNPATKPRWNTENLIGNRKPRDRKPLSMADVLAPSKSGVFTCSFMEDSTIVRNDAPCEKEVVLSIPEKKERTKKRKTHISHVVADASHADTLKKPVVPESAKPLQSDQRGNRAKSVKNTCTRLTPQEMNGQIIEQGRNKLAGMTNLPRQSKPVASRSQSARRSGDSIPALKRDGANRNVVVVADRAKNPPKTDGVSATTLERFVIGPSNRLAVRAVELAIHHTGQISPIYIFGPTSVGKTHLLETIRSGLRRDRQAKPPIMMTAEQFTSSFIDGLKQGIPLFRNKFRGISALLIDDIQFFAGKESTQTEFLRTIEQLKGQGIQVVLTGDRPLHGLVDLLKPEIVSRLEAGMQCEIKPAEYETLLAVFKQMAASRNLKLSDDVCAYVVSHLTTHARQLSGAVNRLHAMMLTSQRPITLESVENILEDMIRNNRRAVRLQDIDKAVCETLQLSGQVLQSKSRAKQATQPRMLAMWLARKYTRSALSEIGKYFGDRSHSTVVSAQKKVDQWLRETPDFGLADSSMPINEVIQKVERLLQTRRPL